MILNKKYNLYLVYIIEIEFIKNVYLSLNIDVISMIWLGFRAQRSKIICFGSRPQIRSHLTFPAGEL